MFRAQYCIAFYLRRNKISTYFLGEHYITTRIVIFTLHLVQLEGRDTLVGIATRYGLEGPGIESRWGAKFSSPVHTGPGGRPILLYNGHRVSFREVKRPESVADHPPPSCVDTKETAALYFYAPLGLHGLLQSELYLLLWNWPSKTVTCHMTKLIIKESDN